MSMEFEKQILELNKLNTGQFLTHLKNLDPVEKTKLIYNHYLIQLSNDKFKILLFDLTEEQFKIFLDDEKFYSKILSLSDKKSILNVFQNNKLNFLKLMFENKNVVKYASEFIDYLIKLDNKKFKEITSLINVNVAINSYINFNDKDELYKYLIIKFKDELDNNFNDIYNILLNKIINNKLDPVYLLKINNYKELILYTKFNILVKVESDLNDITLENGFVILYEEVLKIKDSKINKIIELLKSKGEATDLELLEVALKLYYVFGFDYSKKIIEDKFTNMTESAINKIAEFNYKDERREYRAKNQKKFYYYGMVQEVLNSLMNGSNEIFECLSYYGGDEIQTIKKEFSELLVNSNNGLELKSSIRELLKEKIRIREQKYKDEYYKTFKEKYTNKEKREITTKELLNLLKSVDILKIINEYDETTLNQLHAFLLGNTKGNNDCLLRIIINKEALGLNDNLFELINSFKVIQSISKTGNLSLNSILDIIDIIKINFYKLKPNEQDIYLDTLTKIINSTEYCNITGNNIVREICKLHVERKNKVYSTIPTVKGICGKYTYEIAPFDSEYLLSSGVDGNNCFKISGLGEELFKYCLTNKNAAVIYIRGNNKTYIVPVIRSGNIINCNNLDPCIEPGEELNVIKTLETCLHDIIAKSKIHDYHEKNIELATITNWHIEKILEKTEYETIKIEEAIPLDNICYNDINKKDIINYVIAKSDTFESINYYLSEDKFYQERNPNYEFNINNEYDKERLSLIVNSISYSAIDYQNISIQEKNKNKRYYKKIDVSKFKYIIGNKDWYVAIDDSFNVVANILPYDDRAKKDYFEALANVSTVLRQLMEEEEYDRQNIRKNR